MTVHADLDITNPKTETFAIIPVITAIHGTCASIAQMVQISVQIVIKEEAMQEDTIKEEIDLIIKETKTIINNVVRGRFNYGRGEWGRNNFQANHNQHSFQYQTDMTNGFNNQQPPPNQQYFNYQHQAPDNYQSQNQNQNRGW